MRHFFLSVPAALSLFFLMAACSDDFGTGQDSAAKTPIDVADLQGEELDKYAYGCEYYAEDTISKVETSANDAYRNYAAEMAADFLSGLMAEAGTGNKSISSGPPMVGVLKVKTCGRYREVEILFDTEDRRTKNDVRGFSVDWSVSRRSNAHLRFCVVPAHLFDGIGQDYAVLLLHPQIKTPRHESRYSVDAQTVLRIRLDAEDKRPLGKVVVKEPNGRGEEVSSTEVLPNFYDSGNNLTLYLQHIPQKWNVGVLPSLGFDYAVFGTLSNKPQGNIMLDCEDHSNNNGFDVISAWWTGSGGFADFSQMSGTNIRHKGTYRGIVNVDDNVRFFFSMMR